MKIFSIVGARPQFIKLAPLSAGLAGRHVEVIVHTGQHYDYAMSEKIFLDLGIRKPDIHLGVEPGNQTRQVANMMIRLEEAMLEHQPHVVIVFGDTNSTLAGSLVAAKLGISIIHIEAGLRSFNRGMPEEINRIVTDHVSQYLFAPTQTALTNLRDEGLEKETYLTGDIMVDTMKNSISIALKKSRVLADLGLEAKPFNLFTLHRHYNVDDHSILEHILCQLGKLEELIIFPVHPRTRKNLSPGFQVPGNIHMIEPQGYMDFVALEYASRRIITDSGGIQKEAYILRKPCITLRTETEWVETVEEGWNCLINPMSKTIAHQILDFNPPEKQTEIFGKNVTENMVGIMDSIH